MPSAVVGHANEAASAGLDFHGDARGLGIERVFDQFLHDAGGAFHHFAGGDLVGDVFGKQADAVHETATFSVRGEGLEKLVGDFRRDARAGVLDFGDEFARSSE